MQCEEGMSFAIPFIRSDTIKINSFITWSNSELKKERKRQNTWVSFHPDINAQTAAINTIVIQVSVLSHNSLTNIWMERAQLGILHVNRLSIRAACRMYRRIWHIGLFTSHSYNFVSVCIKRFEFHRIERCMFECQVHSHKMDRHHMKTRNEFFVLLVFFLLPRFENTLVS